MWEAARATSAPSTFFERVEIGRAQPFIDGGVGRNNPSRVVLDEANTLGTRPIGCLVSIGTGQFETISIGRPGFFQRMIPTDIISSRAESYGDRLSSCHRGRLRLRTLVMHKERI